MNSLEESNTRPDSMSPASPGVVLSVDLEVSDPNHEQLRAVLEREGYVIAERDREVFELKRFFDEAEPCELWVAPEVPITYGPVKTRKGKQRRW